jgi:two-component SAPR family response regulator
MHKLFLNLIFIFFFQHTSCLNAQGIEFNSSDFPIIKRTSYNVFEYKQPKFSGEFNIDFELLLKDTDKFGYIINVKDNKTPVSYSLVYVSIDKDYGEIKLNLDGVKTLVSIPFLKEIFNFSNWIRIYLSFNPITKKITLSVNGKEGYSKENKFKLRIEPEIYFGKHRSIIDVPPISIKGLSIKNNKSLYYFGLNESEGNKVYDSKGDLYGNVKNGNWLIKESFFWKLRHKSSFKQVTSITFDKKKHRFIFQNSDSLKFYNFKNEETSFFKFKNKLDVSMRLGNSLLDPSENKLYVYELYDVSPKTSSIVAINLDNPNDWKSISDLERSKQTHHHNALFNSTTQKINIFGGYGYFSYSNDFSSYDIKANKWENLDFSGDKIDPRFFSGIAKLTENKALLFGGQGNKTGDQSIGKTYYYDCYVIDFDTKYIKKLWEIDREGVNMVSSRNLVINKDTSAFYNLSYSEYISSTFLQIYEYSLKDGSYRMLGDSISMKSDRIRSNANLYFDSKTNELFTTIQEFQEDGSSEVKIYSLDSPPVSKDKIQVKIQESNRNYNYQYIALFFFFIIILIVIVFIFNKKEKIIIKTQIEKALKYENIKDIENKVPNSVLLFGLFNAIDKKGNDISHLFSPKIRQLFLLLIFHSSQNKSNGISSEKIHSILWPDSSEQSAKNLKNVALNQLRNIIKDFEGLEIIYSDRKFILEFSDQFYCDYFVFIKELDSFKEGFQTGSSLFSLIKILRKGKFLQFIDEEYFDIFKQNLETDVLGVIPDEMKKLYHKKEYADVITLADILFNIDLLNMDAFLYKTHSFIKMKLNSKAKKQFNYFVNNYRKITGDDFNMTYRDVSNKVL